MGSGWHDDDDPPAVCWLIVLLLVWVPVYLAVEAVRGLMQH